MLSYKLTTIPYILLPNNVTIKADIKMFPPIINQSLHSYLIKSKSKINDCQKYWNTMKKITNPYEYIHTPYEQRLVISKLKPLSRAYYKMVEIIDNFYLLDIFKYKSMTSFHLAEGPGGFIEALVHKRINSTDKYYGMTLVNDNKNVPGWKKSTKFLNKNPNVIIETGADNTGNLFSYDNALHCYEKYGSSIDLITGDGGFDFSVDYNNQEQNAIKLIFIQIAYAIIMQKQNGHFILKMFDTHLSGSVQMLFILNCLYKSVYIYKPKTSRYANSEKYIICKNYKYQTSFVMIQRILNIVKIIVGMDEKIYNQWVFKYSFA